MKTRRRPSASLAAVSIVLLVVTLIWPRWIEWLTGAEPDGGDGSLELAVAVGFALLAVASGLDLVVGWLRSRRSHDESPDW